ncbi:MAG: sigma-70 family RNA polymerase sigma factor [Myxococcota bacterium]
MTSARIEFDQAILPHIDELYGSAMRLTRASADAEDLVQEAIMRAWAFWDRFQPGTNARAWIHRILTNTFINGYRRKKREREAMAEVRAEGRARMEAENPAPLDGVSDEVDAALRDLPEEFRAAVLLVDGTGLSYREASDALDCPIGTVMSRLHRGRRLLKLRLRQYAAAEGYIRDAA